MAYPLLLQILWRASLSQHRDSRMSERMKTSLPNPKQRKKPQLLASQFLRIERRDTLSYLRILLASDNTRVQPFASGRFALALPTVSGFERRPCPA
jgi:hypothetical protein